MSMISISTTADFPTAFGRRLMLAFFEAWRSRRAALHAKREGEFGSAALSSGEIRSSLMSLGRSSYTTHRDVCTSGIRHNADFRFR